MTIRRGGVAAQALVALAGMAWAGAPVLAQADYSGRSFAGVTLAAPPQDGAVALAAARADVWLEDDGAAGTQRVLLRGDVRVTLGVYAFSSAQAVVWAQRLSPAGADAASAVWQVAVYFDRVGEASAAHGSTQAGDRLLVTGTIRGAFSLRADVLREGRPADPLLNEGEARLANFLRGLAEPGAGDRPLPAPIGLPAVEGVGPMRPGLMRPYEPNSPYARAREAAAEPAVPAATEAPPSIFAGGGTITIAAGEPTLIAGQGTEETVLQVTGGVTVQYTDPRRGRSLLISAERAIVFFVPGKLEDVFRASEERVLGIYVEGNVVATDGRFTLRGEQVYYDVKANQAAVADAVFWTYDQTRAMPLYVRAKSLRQTAANRVEAERVTLANSSFFTPHLSMGARTLTVTREADGPGGGGRTLVEGRDLTLRLGSTPFFYWPSYRGDVERFPLKEIGFENSSNSGAGVKTRWDLFGLLGQDAPIGTRFDLLLDGFLDRGVGIGTDSAWRGADQRGEVLAYIVPDDNGRDLLSSGEKKERDHDTRGIVAAEQTFTLDRTWSLQLEGAYVSDENVVDAYYETLAETRREFATSAYLRAIDNNSQFGLLAKGSVNDFVVNEYLLQSQGYSVTKLPEGNYSRVADDPLFFLWPGLVNWSQDYRLGLLAFNLTEKTPADYGYSTPGAANAAFGPGAFGLPGVSVGPGQTISDVLEARGFDEHYTARLDTRQELSAPFQVGPVNVTPFGVGRFTLYDDRFEQYRSFVDPQDAEKYRVWYSAGVHLKTSVQRVDESVESDFFDLHKIRHIVEPHATAWTSGANLRREELPIYDEQVEGISEGTAYQVGMTNTWQTQRGGEGRWRSVDVLTLRTDYQYATADTERKSPIQKFFDYRPEYSVFGEGFTVDAIWQATDATAFTVNYVYDLDRNQPARTTAGMKIDHSSVFSTFIEAHYLNERDATYVSFGGTYRLTDLYSVGMDATYDVDEERFQSIGGRISRELPSLIVSVKLAYNDITEEFSAGLALQPVTRDRERERLRRLGRDQLDLGPLPADAGRESSDTLLK